MGVATSVSVEADKRHKHTASVRMGAHHREDKTRMNYMLPDTSLHGNFKYFAMLFKNDVAPYEHLMDKNYLKNAFKKYGYQEELLNMALSKCDDWDKGQVDIDEFMENMRLSQKKLLLKLFAPQDVDPEHVVQQIKLLCPLVEEHELEQRVEDYFQHSAVARKLKVKESLKPVNMPMISAEDVESSDGGLVHHDLHDHGPQEDVEWHDDDNIYELLEHFENYDEIINLYYVDENDTTSGPAQIDLNKVKKLTTAFKKEIGPSTVLDIDLPCVLVGDIHAYWNSLMRVFEINGHPKNTKYLFLGDYVDRGPRGVDVLLLLYSLKVKYPKNINMIRGNHEDARVNIKYGFRQECAILDKSNHLFPMLTQIFSHLPFLAVVGGHICCVHGGIPRKVSQHEGLIEELRNKVTLPFADCLSKKMPINHCLGEILWNDPHDETGWCRNMVRGPGFYEYGHDVLFAYLQANKCTHLIRGHEICEVGFHIHKTRRCVTLFTAANYQEKRNFAATLCIHKNGLGIFTVVK